MSGSGTLEKDINLAIALRLERMLQAADVKTVMTRRADEGLDSRKNGSKKVEDLKNRCALISKSKPDCVVSVHQNSYQDAAIRGAQNVLLCGLGGGQTAGPAHPAAAHFPCGAG